MIYFN